MEIKLKIYIYIGHTIMIRNHIYLALMLFFLSHTMTDIHSVVPTVFLVKLLQHQEQSVLFVLLS